VIFSESYIGRLRRQVGHDLIKVPGGRIVIEDAKGHVLLQQRVDFGIWGLPAGCPESNETASESITREVFEETGLEVLELIPFGYSSNPDYEIVEYPNGDLIHAYSLLFVCRRWEGHLIQSNVESLAVVFYALDALPAMIPNHRRTLEMYLQYKQTGQFQLD
jgi:ADP-ribose pyrophosphatase YjhB (NUDIX family)